MSNGYDAAEFMAKTGMEAGALGIKAGMFAGGGVLLAVLHTLAYLAPKVKMALFGNKATIKFDSNEEREMFSKIMKYLDSLRNQQEMENFFKGLDGNGKELKQQTSPEQAPEKAVHSIEQQDVSEVGQNFKQLQPCITSVVPNENEPNKFELTVEPDKLEQAQELMGKLGLIDPNQSALANLSKSKSNERGRSQDNSKPSAIARMDMFKNDTSKQEKSSKTKTLNKDNKGR